MVTSAILHPHPIDATLTVAKAAQVLGVHPNTVRAWSDAARLRYYRINSRGDRRYRVSDLNRFMTGAAAGAVEDNGPTSRRGARLGALSIPDSRSRRALRSPESTVDRQQRIMGGSPLRVEGDGQSIEHLAQDLAGSQDSAEDARNAHAAIAVLTGLGRLASSMVGPALDPETILGTATRTIREGAGFRHVSIWRRSGDRLDPVGVSGPAGARLRSTDARSGVLGTALNHRGAVVGALGEIGDPASTPGIPGRRLACAIPGPDEAWGALLVITEGDQEPSATTRELVAGVAGTVGTILGAADAAAVIDHRIHWAEALGRVAGDIGVRLDSDQLLARLVDHALAMFGGDRGAVFLFNADGSRRTAASRGLSGTYLAALAPGGLGLLTQSAVDAGQPVYAVGFRDDRQGTEVRASVVQEGYDTICIAPLIDAETSASIGSLNVYHDRRHPWSKDELDALSRLAVQASNAIRSARTYAQLATWAAQLQSIQQLGARLNQLSDVAAIGMAIANELHELIDYHNVRVYRQYGDDLIPVAMSGNVGEYADETMDQLAVKVGSGITGWVAAHRTPESLPDAAADPRANTIPGTDRDTDESMLLAPMIFGDEVLGVLVLSKLGLNQFADDDLRLLVIYASFAAQAMAHADATQRLQRQLQSRRDLIQITESILSSLDTSSVLESVADRLGELVESDNIWIELVDEEGSSMTPVMARGVSAVAYLEPFLPGETGIATWVVEHNEPAFLPDQFHDSRVLVGEAGPVHGGLICVPLRGRSGAIGVLSIERLGEGRSFTEDEFELVQLFAAQVSIAVLNARAHGAITRQAETDDLTGLRNHRSFRHALVSAVASGDPFSLLMVDLDRFKLVNDTFGHEAGNAFLKAIAAAIVGASRDSDTVFRYGGDEFVVLLPRTDATHVGPVADRIRSAFAKVAGPTSEMRREGVHVDASAGVATYPTDGTSADAVLLAADRACYLVKRDGGGRVGTAAEGLALAGEFTLTVPTPIDTGP